MQHLGWEKKSWEINHQSKAFFSVSLTFFIKAKGPIQGDRKVDKTGMKNMRKKKESSSVSPKRKLLSTWLKLTQKEPG